MALPSAAGARFRQRKISVKQTLSIWKQSDLPDLETEDQQRELQQFETGVEKGEEEEHHLQAVINAAQAKISGAKVEQVYIPTPDASKVWQDASKYYTQKFIAPASYIRFSATVEDTAGCPYNMDEKDEEYLEKMNKELPPDIPRCTETEFEIISHRFETVINEKQPFLAMDPEHILTFDEIKPIALQPDKTSPEDVARTLEQTLNIHPFITLLDAPPPDGKQPRPLGELFEKFGKQVYAHWKLRRIERKGRSVFPILKFEDPSEKDDSDPYVCFRRREVRQARKTRRSDTQGSERLRKFHRELKNAYNLVFMCAQREVKRKESLKVENDIFKMRCQVKSVKRELGIKGEEEDLIAHKKKKVIPVAQDIKDEDRKDRVQGIRTGGANGAAFDPQALRRTGSSLNPIAVQPYVKLPVSRIPDLDLVTVSAVLHEKKDAITRAVAEKLKKRKLQDEGWINLTDDPLNPLFDIASADSLIKEPSHTPYSSISTSIFEVENSRFLDPSLSKILSDKKSPLPDVLAFSAASGDPVEVPAVEHYDLINNKQLSITQPVYKFRKRFGRRGMWLDRKLNIDDCLQFDSSDSEEEQDADNMDVDKGGPVNVYDSKHDRRLRTKSRFMFDSQIEAYNPIDPSKLNQISSQTQAIRFGCMLLTKAYDQMHQARQKAIEAQKQNAAQAQAKTQQIQSQQAHAQAQVQAQLRPQQAQVPSSKDSQSLTSQAVAQSKLENGKPPQAVAQ
ncbi:unnamed protein product [Kuraishia capsulata CBS 1993]|uniref:Enhancer of polycomb-like protein n=1 Tax=Kuraishia capsulata CBS 1993 TaxID=1382522 RepID=W6MLK9_9ASCO|nr:uncharacterized protein KUCA_T00003377001 [Kuraishia capsulata CBS 1993]CDK27399.1 unnamed protein product [Kuraishia capsulata CBS 1993]